jgi:predicted Rossmann fold nucleotide-binding protein DprA/Smf involved in DNA uptake
VGWASSAACLGIDAAAHRGGLSGPGRTVAVIGTGADRIYPARNGDLARRIAAKGPSSASFPWGFGPLAHNFPVATGSSPVWHGACWSWRLRSRAAR